MYHPQYVVYGMHYYSDLIVNKNYVIPIFQAKDFDEHNFRNENKRRLSPLQREILVVERITEMFNTKLCKRRRYLPSPLYIVPYIIPSKPKFW